MRVIHTLVVHCADTPKTMDIGAKEIREWHLGRGWNDIGYHFVIRRDGVLELGRDLSLPGAHVEGHNQDSIGVCLVGGKGGFNFTRAQFWTLDKLIENMQRQFPIKSILGHRDFPGVQKECPCFDVKSWLMEG